MSQQIAVQVTGKDGKLTENFEDNLQITKTPVPAPQDGEVLVRVLYRPVNPSDVYRLIDMPGRGPTKLPFVPGLEGYGEVEENGPGTSGNYKTGDRVVAVPWPSRETGMGTWQQYVAVPEKNLVRVPDPIDSKPASQFLVNPVTAFGLVDDMSVPEGKWLLQTAAGSVLGRIVIAIAKKRGVKTINVVRRSEQKQELLDLGADEVIATDKEDLVSRVQEITGGEGAYGALDAVGGKEIGTVLDSIRASGRVFLYGALGGPEVSYNVLKVIYEAKKVEGWVLFDWLYRGGDAKEKLQKVWDLFLDGTIQPYTGEVFPLEKAAEAVQASLRVGRGGKILIEG
ncbi:g7033 [Coccomyxa elongata]